MGCLIRDWSSYTYACSWGLVVSIPKYLLIELNMRSEANHYRIRGHVLAANGVTECLWNCGNLFDIGLEVVYYPIFAPISSQHYFS